MVTKSSIIAELNAYITPNGVGGITGAVLNTALIDLTSITMSSTGSWSNVNQYFTNDVVQYNGSSYVAISANVNSAPPSSNWTLLSSIGLPATTPFADDTSVIAWATGASFTIPQGFLYYNTTSSKLRLYGGTTFADYDVSAQTASTNAQGFSASAQSYMNSTSTYAISAAASASAAATSAASAVAVSSLSNLNAAARAVALVSDVSAVFIYDTKNDTDGGAWRRKVAHTSWFTETLNTSTRGVRQDFPSKVLIVARANATVLTLYDLDDPTCPMWMVFIGGGGTTMVYTGATYIAYDITARDGIISLAQNTTLGYTAVDFILETGIRIAQSTTFKYTASIALRASGSYIQIASSGLSGADAIGVASTTLPNSRLRAGRAKLPNPTFVIATTSGATVVNSEGTIFSSASTAIVVSTCFDDQNNLYTLTGAALNISNSYMSASWNVAALATFTAAQLGVSTLARVRFVDGVVVVAGLTGIAKIKLDLINPANSLINVTTTTFNSGWGAGAQGLLKASFAESSSNLSSLVGGTATDRSGSANNATVNGTISRLVVATGAELAAYGGFSAANYLEVPANAALDFGTGDFSASVWATANATTTNSLFSYGVGTGAGWQVNAWSNNFVYFSIASTQLASSAIIPATGSIWYKIDVIRRNGIAEIYFNGVKVASGANSATATAAGGTLRIGNGGVVNTQSGVGAFYNNGSIANARISAFAPTPDQIALMYAQEAPLFQGNAKCLLLGSTNAQALAGDPDLDQLAVATTVGTNLFKGLLRVSYQQSTQSANLIAKSCLPATWSYVAASLGNQISGPSGWGNQAWQLIDTAVSTTHYASGLVALASGTTYTISVPLQAASQGFAFLEVDSNHYAWFNLTTGAAAGVSAGTTANTSVNLGNGWWLCSLTAVAGGNLAPLIAAATSGASNTYVGAGTAAINIGKPMVVVGSTPPTTYVDGLSNNDNHKSVAFMDGNLVLGTASGVDAILPPTVGLRETAKARKVAPIYDPTWGTYSGLTVDATPTVVASVPIAEGKAFRFRATVGAVMYGGVATEKATYSVEGIVTRDIGGNVVVVTTTTTISEVTSTMDCIAQANTSAQTLEIKVTGKATTRIGWWQGVELYDIGLQGAA